VAASEDHVTVLRTVLRRTATWLRRRALWPVVEAPSDGDLGPGSAAGDGSSAARTPVIRIHDGRGRVRHVRVTRLRVDLLFAASVLCCALFLNAVLGARTAASSTFLGAGLAEALGEHSRRVARFEALAARYGEVQKLAFQLDARP